MARFWKVRRGGQDEAMNRNGNRRSLVPAPRGNQRAVKAGVYAGGARRGRAAVRSSIETLILHVSRSKVAIKAMKSGQRVEIPGFGARNCARARN